MAEIKEFKNMKKINIGGTEYTVQKLPVRQSLELREQWQDSEVKMFEMVLEHFIVNPKVSLDDFEDVATADELVTQALAYIYKTKGK